MAVTMASRRVIARFRHIEMPVSTNKTLTTVPIMLMIVGCNSCPMMPRTISSCTAPKPVNNATRKQSTTRII
jgi:hypothetical protein